MQTTVKRIIKTNNSTMSYVLIDGVFQLFGLEPSNPIPAGKYKLSKYFSPKHGKYVPLVNYVQGHSFIEIHSGNYPKDTLDCLLLGYELSADLVSMSTQAIDKYYGLLFPLLDKCVDCEIEYLDCY